MLICLSQTVLHDEESDDGDDDDDGGGGGARAISNMIRDKNGVKQ